jgi:hypothetical protein
MKCLGCRLMTDPTLPLMALSWSQSTIGYVHILIFIYLYIYITCISLKGRIGLCHVTLYKPASSINYICYLDIQSYIYGYIGRNVRILCSNSARYIYIYVRTYVYMYVHMYIYMCIHRSIYIHLYIYVYLDIHI